MLKIIVMILALALAGPALAGAGFWTPSGPEGGYINQVVADPVAANTYYAVGNATVYYSADGAVTWSERAAGLSGNLAPYSLSIRPGVAGHLLLGAGNHLFVTTNGGLSWQDSTLTLPDTERVTDTAIADGQPDRWLVGVYGNKVYMTDDGGLTWAQRGSGFFGDEIASVLIDPADSNHFWLVSYDTATAEARLYESTDAGLNWADVSARIPFALVVGHYSGIYMHDLRIGNTGRMYLVSMCDIAPGQTKYCLYISADGGVNWNYTLLPMVPGPVIVNPANDLELYLGGVAWPTAMTVAPVLPSCWGIFRPVPPRWPGPEVACLTPAIPRKCLLAVPTMAFIPAGVRPCPSPEQVPGTGRRKFAH